ncbi:MAG: peptide chain release factor N(5)-glutamine methyltransferase [Gemmatimonas sp.]|jgi:release factor glutamine methyltransferase|uniref:peptide chain release factor N(5)-glutamine methyltransferase n=1 Tax=Gemmatimonas sp. TaxID=1962908 RepID=UPI00391F494C|nr:peptide chain release factor N(5)-glutamine methyltransferase [Gemmatimonadota bacterium]
MTLRDVVTRVVGLLAEADRLEPEVRQDAAREGRLLVAAVLGLSPGELAQRLVLHPVITPAEMASVERALHRRLRGEPLAYAVGTAAFRDLVLQVDARVLIPRPETEVVVGEALRVTADRVGGIAVDIGTGSGAIALSLAMEGHFARVIATDISADALAVASANAERLWRGGAPVEFRMGADLAPIAGERARVLVANPPYIAYAEATALPASVRDWEPPLALFAPDDGLARYRALIAGASAVLEPGGWLVCEVDTRRAALTAELAESAGLQQVQVVQDLSGRDRVLVAQTPSAGN